ncbi:hypothetical protein BV898_04602 [Hypsibius exemplaris]|uniref:SnoaL-like domain-containing protein n=1 Tax=Hypsibius exemplaris TaxID=2072580 RepID=A0A1W0X1R2_HYPEX|nr:hypothetical protein BV898_04602 [Hypsibius exemplaris]
MIRTIAFVMFVCAVVHAERQVPNPECFISRPAQDPAAALCAGDNDLVIGNETLKNNIRLAMAAFDGRAPLNPAVLGFMSPTYVQHQLEAIDGTAGVIALLTQLAGKGRVNVVRVLHDEDQDGDYVVAHTDFPVFAFLGEIGPKIGFDVFRFEDGKVVEHWDQLQITPSELNPSGRSMVDGVTQVTPATKSQTKANKALAKAYVEDILVNGRTEKLRSFFDGDNYIQHNPTAGDGVSGLIAAFGSATAKKVKYNRIRLVLGEGDFVLLPVRERRMVF